ncbi:DUF4926 domain-containing protein [[Limnothrix rosea] IAM M-220]|uniref:DUF4926 domain-containing protein n=1 Tax=[Limnothrix rosea] IAM M-220 TaxID=454133 RepID=UPI00096A1BA6|nr:DUF4926 domain-containing protein [[Limnothrix rosea] IAM M-220]OKH11162.1 hypothetical protein NIES208_17735 [[Limnothrix rosea] IAM M-220]
MKFQLFDNVKLTEDITLNNGEIISKETRGTIVEVFNNGEAYLVEFFGNWVKYDSDGYFIPADKNGQDSFTETLGLETIHENQIVLTASARDLMGAKEHLTCILETLPDDLVLQVRDFAEFLQQKKATTLEKHSV